MAPDPATVVVNSEAYYALGKLFATVSNDIASALLQLASALDGCGGMAGSDDAARDWAAKHDANVKNLLNFAARLGRAQGNFGGLVHQCGANHEIAEHHVAGQGSAAPPSYSGGSECPYNDPPSALGDNGPGIQGFVELLNKVKVPVPNGDTGKLNAAAQALNSFADTISTSMTALNLIHNLGADDALESGMPEAEQMTTRGEAVIIAAPALAQAARSIAASCQNYATYLTNTRNKIMDAINNAMQMSVAMYAVATALAAETAGLSELLATAGAAAKLDRAAEDVGEVITQGRAQAAAAKTEASEVQPGAVTSKLDDIAGQPLKKLELDGNGGAKEVTGLNSRREAQYQKYLDRKAKDGKTPKSREQWERMVENLE